MALAGIDYTIVIVYLLFIVWIGLYVQRKTKENVESFFLGSRSIPWWALGASGMASNLDVSGTMINTALVYALGVNGFFVEIRGGVTLALAFLMIYSGKWNRRSQVMTLAEWMELRFGPGKQGALARILAALSLLIKTIAAITYFAIGSGKFLGEILGMDDFLASFVMIALSMVYTVASGLAGVVYTDLAQGIIILFTIVAVCIRAVAEAALPASFSVSVPLQDGGFASLNTTRADWTDPIPPWTLSGLPEGNDYQSFERFGVIIMFYMLKIILEGSGGLESGYMMQRYFAAKSDSDCGRMSLMWMLLLAFRWPLIGAFAMLGIQYGMDHGAPIEDPERVLPIVVAQMIPTGLKGFLVAGLCSAAMSTFDSTINGAAAYWVQDIYRTHVNPHASQKQLVNQGRIASVAIVSLGLAFSLMVKNINQVWGWINLGLGAGLLAPLVVRFYWWRLNGYGFAAGMSAGLVAALIQMGVWPHWLEYDAFLWSIGFSSVAMFSVTMVTEPTPTPVLEKFYYRTRPFGFWGPAKTQIDHNTKKKIEDENTRDAVSTPFAVLFQLSLFLAMMSLVFFSFTAFAALLCIAIACGVFLYAVWYRHIDDPEITIAHADSEQEIEAVEMRDGRAMLEHVDDD